ncbi:hypothetical protein GUJ93_ZPchr0007g4518 [Zizania palustris]|uniref:PTM/DIR17-like Tudor domain-containing protein n=1 Tax=Zizania palustris TaxID=103762 RepID=A0A8J5T3Y6_ZIZPA|nr:hypothetical protein GUJ93_ZPchr0007g4518 [Zizania palustris]
MLLTSASTSVSSLVRRSLHRAAAPASCCFPRVSPVVLTASKDNRVMEEAHGMQESDTVSVMKVPREPAIIINGVPDLPPDQASESQLEPSNAAEPQVDHHFGEWLEGRKVSKLFGDKHYVGKVVKYGSEGNWYNVVYDDGDQEDLEWHEVEEILLPLDITIPLKTLVMDKCGLQSAVPDFRSKVGRPRKVYATLEDSTNKASDMVPISQGINIMGNHMMTGAVNGQQSNDACGKELVTVTAGEDAQACVNVSSQPRKRGRPRKNVTVPVNTPPKKRSRLATTSVNVNTQPKKRGRPPKNRNVSGNAQGVLQRHNSVLQRNAETAKAEKLAKAERLKRANMHGTQLL